VNLQKHRPWSRQIFGDNGVQDRARHATLNDDSAKTTRPRNRFVIVQWITVTTHLREKLDIAGRDLSRPPSRLTN